MANLIWHWLGELETSQPASTAMLSYRDERRLDFGWWRGEFVILPGNGVSVRPRDAASLILCGKVQSFCTCKRQLTVTFGLPNSQKIGWLAAEMGHINGRLQCGSKLSAGGLTFSRKNQTSSQP